MTLAVCALLTGTLAQAGDQPAVSQTNGKIDLLGGNVDGDGAVALAGSLSAPLGHAFGVQIDGLAGNLDGEGTWGLGTHLFWRDPGRGLLGLTASRNNMNGRDADRAGLEGELYLDRFTLGAVAGQQNGDVKDGAYLGLSGSYYLNDNLMLQGAAQGIDGDHLYALGAEWQPPAVRDGLAFFANATSGDGDAVDSAIVGVRFYFGGSKSLKQRHREDDPVNPLLNSLTGAANGLMGCTGGNTTRINGGYSEVIDCNGNVISRTPIEV